MGASRYRVDLSEDEREHLRQVTRRGKAPARKVTRARILKKADEGLFDRQIAAALDVGMATVWRTRKRPDGIGEGLESALPVSSWPQRSGRRYQPNQGVRSGSTTSTSATGHATYLCAANR